MNKFAKIGLLGLLLGAIVAPAVHAQDDTQPVNKPISIKLGVYLPDNSSVRDGLGSAFYAAGVDYAFNKSTGDTPVLPLVYFDYQGADKHGVSGNLYDIGVGVRAYPNRNNGQTVIPFYGAGIGLDFLNTSGGGNNKTYTELAGKLELGAELNTGPFIEAEYQIIPESIQGVHVDGFNIMIGDRF